MIVTGYYKICLTEEAMETFKAAASTRGATAEDLFNGVLEILGSDPALLWNVIEAGDGKAIEE